MNFKFLFCTQRFRTGDMTNLIKKKLVIKFFSFDLTCYRNKKFLIIFNIYFNDLLKLELGLLNFSKLFINNISFCL